MDLQVIQIDPLTGVVSLEIPKLPRRLTGIDKLVQVVALALLKDPGQDVFDPADGAGLRALIGQYNFTDVEELRAVVSQKIRLIETQILAEQPIDASATERLKEIKMQDIGYDELTRSLMVRLRILNEADTEADIIV